MAVFYMGQRVPWRIPGMKPDETIHLDPATFDPRILPRRRIEMGDGSRELVPVPQVPNRISVRRDGHIELILERYYDREARQSRNKKVIIGTDGSGILPGMMIPNDRYAELFDANGRLWEEQKTRQEAESKEERPKEERPKEEEPKEEKPKKTQKKEPKADKPAENPETARKDGQEAERPVNTDALEKALLRREAEISRKEEELRAREEALEEAEEQLAEEFANAEQSHARLLSYMLESYIDTVQQQAKRKPDAPMSPKQIRTINELLSELRSFFTGSESEDYLHLAEEPDEATNTPGTTNGEMALLLTAYHCTLNAYLYHDLRSKQKP